MKKLIIIDAYALIHRVFYALPPLTSPKGEVVNAVYGFSLVLMKILKELKPDYILAAFDLPKPTFRHKEYKEYKATRVKAPDELYAQIPKIKEVLKSFGIPIYQKEGFEADDIIGTIVTKNKNLKIKNVIATGDLDTLQLVDKNTEVFGLKKGISETIVYNREKILERYGLTPEQLIDLKALKGDPSDNILGIKGIGEKTAINLLKKFKNLENLYKKIEKNKTDVPQKIKEKLIENKERVFFNKDLVKIRKDVPLDFNLKNCKIKFSKEKIISLFKKFGFFSLIKRIKENENLDLKKDKNFQDNIFEKDLKINLLESKNIDNLIKEVKEKELLAIYLDYKKKILEVSSLENKVYVLDFLHNKDSGQIFKKLEVVLSDKKIKKIGYDLKKIFKFFLRNYGIWVESLTFDLMIAEYLLNPDRKNYSLEEIFLKNFSNQNFSNFSVKLPFILKIKDILEKKLKEMGFFEIFQKIEMPLVYILAQMELIGIKIDIDYFKKLNSEFEKKLKSIENKIYNFAGFKFNINSPYQLAEVIFGKLKISSKGIKKTQKLKRSSTQASELMKLKGRHKIIDLILEYRELAKLKTTYINSILKLVDLKSSRIFSTFSQVGTSTGRLVSLNPNLQNLPIKTELGRKIRKGFIAEKNYLLVSFDYSQIELRIVASLANDKKMIKAFDEKKDIHKITASLVFNVDENKVTKKMRNFAKTLNFGILYGMGVQRLAQATSMSQEEASLFINRYFSDFKGISEFIENIKIEVREKGYIKNLLGRIRYFPQIFSSNFKIQRAAERAAVNMPVQSLAADIIKLSMIEIFKFIDSEFDFKNKLKKLFLNKDKNLRKYNLPIFFVLQIHDELIFEIKKDLLNFLAPKIKTIMENVIKLKTPLLVECLVGKNLSDLK